jgi:hypothetical protein
LQRPNESFGSPQFRQDAFYQAQPAPFRFDGVPPSAQLNIPRSIQLSDIFGPDKLELLYKLVCLEFDPSFKGPERIDWTRKPFIARGQRLLEEILKTLPPLVQAPVEPYDPTRASLYNYHYQ